MDTLQLVVLILVALCGVGFIAGIASAFWYSYKNKPDSTPRFVKTMVTTLSGILATNLGAVLGINIKQNGGFTAQAFLLATPVDAPSAFQMGALYLYLVGLLIAVICWGILKFEEDTTKVVVTLPQLSYTFLGVAAGVLTTALGH